MSDSLSLRFLYNTVCGRAVLKQLVRPGISEAAGRFLDSKASRVLINTFKKQNKIELDGIIIPDGGFESFNAFFSRKREKSVFDISPDAFCSPCDAWLTCFDIDENSSFYIKNSRYSLSELLKNSSLAQEFKNGTALIFRLTPADYHRYCFMDNARIIKTAVIPGVLHTVRPIATERFKVYIQNSREYALMQSENFGRLVQMEVGALLVGRIKNHPCGEYVKRGEEKGCFEFGGSTIVMLTQKGALKLDARFNAETEIHVRQGEKIGNRP